MRITQTITETRAARADLDPLAMVPTMGALHPGHLSLIRRARALAPHVAVSIFVNPTQFGPGEDFDRYPRPVERDLELCEAEGVDLVFSPTPEQMYPAAEIETVIDVPSLTTILEGAHRPGHFIGVCRVVAKLLNILRPDIACFGLKDYQQLRVIEAMTEAMCMPVRIDRCPTVREPDGLAMSSRNAYLTPDQRRHATGLIKALREAERLIRDGESSPARVESAMRQIVTAHHFDLDYTVVRDARTLGPVDAVNPSLAPVACLAAAHLADVRLIDNILIG